MILGNNYLIKIDNIKREIKSCKPVDIFSIKFKKKLTKRLETYNEINPENILQKGLKIKLRANIRQLCIGDNNDLNGTKISEKKKFQRKTDRTLNNYLNYCGTTATAAFSTASAASATEGIHVGGMMNVEEDKETPEEVKERPEQQILDYIKDQEPRIGTSITMKIKDFKLFMGIDSEK